MTELRDIWSELEKDAPASPGVAFRRLRVGGSCGIVVQVERPSGNWGVVLEVSPISIPAGFGIVGTKGFSATVSTQSDSGTRRTHLSLAAASRTFNDVFSRMAEDIISAVSKSKDERRAVETFSERLTIWERFFKHFSETGLSAERQRGLFAEVHVLSEDLVPRIGGLAAAHSWTGPAGRPHDFMCPGLAIEVKSSVGPLGGSVEISSARQLDDENAGRPLVLVVVHLEVAASGGETLPQLIARVSSLLETSSPRACERFRDELRATGWDSDNVERYEDKFYTVRHVSYFRVSEGFPRIVEADLPAGVIDVRYPLSLGACEPFRVGAETARAMLTA